MVKGEPTPTAIVLKYESCEKAIVANQDVYTIYLQCQELKTLPLGPNPRDPSEDRTPYKAMVKTLINEPEMFFFKNLGINAIATELKKNKDKKTIEIEFNPGTGVVNGGHTMKAILDVKSEQVINPMAIVRLEVIVFNNLDEDTLVAIAQSKNMTSVLKEYSKANLLGYFNPLKGALKQEYSDKILWYEGAEVSIRALNGDDVIAILNLFNIEKYQDDEQPIASVNSKKTIFNTWQNECKRGNTSLSLLYPLANDIIELLEYVKGTCTKDVGNAFTLISPIANNQCKPPKKQPFTGTPMKYNVDTAILYPLLASLRADLINNNGKIEWIVDPKLLFDNVKKKLAAGVCETWKQDGNLSKLSRNKLFWRDLYRTVGKEVEKMQSGSK